MFHSLILNAPRQYGALQATLCGRFEILRHLGGEERESCEPGRELEIWP
jgi:hypothetical protein